MRIGLMLRHLSTQKGGIGTYSRNVVDALVRNTDHDYFLLYQDPALLGHYAAQSNVTELVYPARTKLGWDQLAVPKAVRQHSIDVIFNLKAAIPLLAPCRKASVIHGGDWFALPHGFPLHDRVYRALLGPLFWRSADALISISQEATRQIVEHLKVDAEKVHTIYYGRDERFARIEDVSVLERVRAKYGLPNHFFLFVGQFYELKNLDRLVKAFFQIKDEVPQHLVIVGQDRWGYLKKKGLSRIGEDERIFFPGWIEHDDLIAFYNLADAYVFPSLYEGFGLPLLEAMGTGCPIVTSTRGAIPEVVGDAAILVEPLDTTAIAGAMKRVANDAALRRALRDNGLERVRHFDWNRCAQQTLSVLKNTVGAPN